MVVRKRAPRAQTSTHTGMLLSVLSGRETYHALCRLLLVIMAVIVAAVFPGGRAARAPVNAISDDSDDRHTLLSLFELAQQDGEAAVAALTSLALDSGGWAPAPGIIPAFDPLMPAHARAAIRVIDQAQAECADPKLARVIQYCNYNFVLEQDTIRFGVLTFASPGAEEELVPRSAPDDILATYIEEAAHSWQEYFHETDGTGAGPRTKKTTWDDGARWMPGWEYQAKAYVLSLDGRYLELSEDERARLRRDICSPFGYANPLGKVITRYGPPPGWPNPEGWPTTNLYLADLEAFCSTYSDIGGEQG
jgi:hypothetical protein